MNALRERVGEATIRGFRAPYYNFDPDIPRILEEMGYLWDSTKAYFPILGRPFRAERHGGIVELPSLHPDDHTLLRRIGLTEEQVLHTSSYGASTRTFAPKTASARTCWNVSSNISGRMEASSCLYPI